MPISLPADEMIAIAAAPGKTKSRPTIKVMPPLLNRYTKHSPNTMPKNTKVTSISFVNCHLGRCVSVRGARSLSGALLLVYLSRTTDPSP